MTELHPRAPWKDVTFTGAYWNCEARLEKLLAYVRPWFQNILVVVQESPDRTLEVARKYADVVIENEWLGRGDPSISTAVSKVKTRYAFVVSDDEWPTESLLFSFQDLVNRLKNEGMDGAWVHFNSTIDAINFTREQDYHLRLFNSAVGWPTSQHARPMTDRTIHWLPDPSAVIHHDRTLDEMMRDYLRRYDLGLKENASDQAMAHNRRMMQAACNAIAERKGWPYVTAFEWWPAIVDRAYEGNAPEASIAVQDVPEPKPESTPVPRRRVSRKK